MLSRRWRQALAPGRVYYWLAFDLLRRRVRIIPLSIYAHSGEDWGFPTTRRSRSRSSALIVCLAALLLIRLIALLACRHRGRARLRAVLPRLVPAARPRLRADPDRAARRLGDGERGAATLYADRGRASRGRSRGLSSASTRSRPRHRCPVLARPDPGRRRLCRSAGGSPIERISRLPGRRTPRPASAAHPGIPGNVYHLVLDAMQTDAFLQALERAGPSARASRASSCSRTTSPTTSRRCRPRPAISAARSTRAADFEDWARDSAQQQGAAQALSDRGYRVWMYAPFAYWQSRYVDHFRHNVDIYEEAIGLAPAGLYDLLHDLAGEPRAQSPDRRGAVRRGGRCATGSSS